ncbi:hypothetical protein ILUMI_17781 [Ignelater luminosus]|uniref:HTH CENPB-type domain-containing protein n=1 Tax=Ignelater luminosus TaxID=2038154 RepID=A0A8K0CNE1_IGNLU|nr:hypothetical protein ILUMI_17781 [Ignelater luminosus]
MDKDNFVAIKGWFHRWKKRQNIVYKRTHGAPECEEIADIRPLSMTEGEFKEWIDIDQDITTAAKQTDRR